MPNPISGPSTALAAGAPARASDAATNGRAATGVDRLGKQEFLQLLVAQLRSQDPMKPMEDKEFITQLAQFSTLETMQSLDKRLEGFTNVQMLGQAAGLIGKAVEAGLADGTLISGRVSEVQLIGGTPRLVVDGQAVELTQVVRVSGQADGAAGLGG